MLSESKYCRHSWTIMLFEKFLQQIPHFESFFHIIILLHIYLANWIFLKASFPYFYIYKQCWRPDSYQLFASLPHVWKWWHGFDFLASPHPILQVLEALSCKLPTPKQPINKLITVASCNCKEYIIVRDIFEKNQSI